MTDLERAQWRTYLDARDGRAVLLWILDQCRIEARSFATDNRTTSFNEGKRAVGIALRQRIETADPHGWLKLIKQEIENAELKRNSTSGNDAARRVPGSIAGTYTPTGGNTGPGNGG